NFSSLGAGKKDSGGNGGGAGELSIAKLQITGGRVTMGQVASQKTTTYENVELTARDISYTSAIPFTFTAKTPGGGKLKLEGNAGPLERADMALTPLDAHVTVE